VEQVELMEYEDREFFDQVMRTARASLTPRQWECLWMQVAGLTQEQVATVLELERSTVARHFGAALGKIQEIAQNDKHNGDDFCI